MGVVLPFFHTAAQVHITVRGNAGVNQGCHKAGRHGMHIMHADQSILGSQTGTKLRRSHVPVTWSMGQSIHMEQTDVSYQIFHAKGRL